MPLGLVQVMPYAIKRVSNYSLPDALGNCDGDEMRDEPACSTEEEGTMEEEDEEEGPGGSNVALGQHSTAERHKHYINTEQDLNICNPELLAVGVVCKRDNHFEPVSTALVIGYPSFIASLLGIHGIHEQRVSLSIRGIQLFHRLFGTTREAIISCHLIGPSHCSTASLQHCFNVQ